MPTLVLHGEFDEATGVVVRASRERIPDVEYVRIAGVSHTPHLERSEETIRVFSEFLARQDRRRVGESGAATDGDES